MLESDYDIVSLGIDQGIANVGYALTGLKNGKEEVLFSGTFKTTTKHEIPQRLKMIYEFINTLLETYHIDVMGMEKLFFNPVQVNGRNKSASIMKTNLVTGIIFLLSSQHQKHIFDYTPGTVKKYVAGHGHASKEQVLAHVEEFASRSGFVIKTDHQADAIAISLTALKQYMEEVLRVRHVTDNTKPKQPKQPKLKTKVFTKTRIIRSVVRQ